MTDDRADRPECHRVDCDDCHAGPGEDHIRTLAVMKNGRVTEIWHRPDCPQYTITQILLQDGARRTEEQEAWARRHFPDAHERLRSAAAAITADPAAVPFVAALTELVQTQADRLQEGGGFVVLHEWAEILERHFPPQDQ